MSQLLCSNAAAHTVLADLQDPETASESKVLVGHSGAIFGLSFSPDQLLLLSCSEDRTSKPALTGIMMAS